MRKLTIVMATILVASVTIFFGGRFGQTNASEQNQATMGSILELMPAAKDLPVQSFDAI